MTNSSPVRLDQNDQVAELVLDRPELLNRIDRETHESLSVCCQRLTASANAGEVRAVVFRSTGKAFSAGGDFDFILEGNASLKARRTVVRDGIHLLAGLLEVPVPIVVALHGDAIGLGASLVLCCDAVVAHPGAGLADPHVAIGLAAGDGGCLAWPLSGGMLLARRYLLTGDRIDAVMAHRLGLVTDLVDRAEDVLPAARKLAERMAALPPLAVQGTKAALTHLVRHRFDEVMEVGLLHETFTLGSEDVREAVSAFRERRPPSFKGC